MTNTQQQSAFIDDNQAQLNSKQDGDQNKKVPHVLMILDGFGHREDDNDNAIAAANMPNLDRIYQQYPHGLISASGEDVGLPDGQFGNSEVGHMNLGAVAFCIKIRLVSQVKWPIVNFIKTKP